MPVRISGSDSTLHDTLAAKNRTRAQRGKKRVDGASPLAMVRNDLSPQLALVDVETEALVPKLRRLRSCSIDDIVEVAQSIQRFGFTAPIIISRDGRSIIDGELRFEAARWLGLETVSCILLKHLSGAEERALRIALNRMGERRQWDVEALKVEFEELILENEPIELLGFDGPEIDQILMGEEDEPEPLPPEPDRSAPPVTRVGDLWALGDHLLLCADATREESYGQLMDGEQARLMLTDPPWNIAVADIVSTRHREFVAGSGEMSDAEFEAFLAAFLRASLAVLVEGGIALTFIDWRQLERLLRAGRETGYELLNIICWVKQAAGMGSLYRSQHELVIAFKKPGAPHINNIELGKHGRNRSNCWHAPGAGTIGSEARAMLAEHPTSKPVGLLTDAMLDVTNRGDIMLDPFGGSGSTLMAAEKTGRIARLIELDPVYCDVILRRWGAAGGAEPQLLETNEIYSVVRERRDSEMETIDADND